MTESRVSIRAEHGSLEGYLKESLSPAQLSRVLVVSFSQWAIATATVGEIAATLHKMGREPIVALWADQTPMRDVGWTTSSRLARAALSPSRDQRVRRGLVNLGLPDRAFPDPPIDKWTPLEELPEPTGLNRSAIRALSYRGASLGRAILQVHPDKDTPITDEHSWPRPWVKECVRSFAFAYDQTAQLIQAREATAVVVFNGRFLHDSAVASAGRNARIPVLSYDFGGNDTDFDLTLDDTHDWSALQGRMRNLYSSWEREEREVIGAGWFEARRRHSDPRNSPFVESQVVGKGFTRQGDRKLVVYFSSSGDEISELDLDWAEYFGGQPGALLALASVCRSRPDLMLLVRTHPHKRMKPGLDVKEWHEAVAEAEPDVHLDEFSDVDSYTLMRQADVVVTYGSTTGVEAAYAGKSVIVLGPSAYDELGCVSRARNLTELSRALDNPIPGDREGALAYGLMMCRRGFNFEYVVKRGGDQTLGGVSLKDSNSLVLKMSDAMARGARGRLISTR